MLAFSRAPIRESVRRCHEVTDEVLIKNPIFLPSAAKAQITLAFSNAPIRESVRRCHEVTDEVLIKISILLPSADRAILFLLSQRRNDVLFLCLKEKERKRSKQTCRLIACACGSGIPKARRPAPLPRPRTIPRVLVACSACGSLETHIVWKPCLTAVVHRQDFTAPKSLFHSRRLLMKNPTSVR